MFAKLICFLEGHKYKHVKHYSFMELWELAGCKRCKRHWVLNHETSESLDWDYELELIGEGKDFVRRHMSNADFILNEALGKHRERE